MRIFLILTSIILFISAANSQNDSALVQLSGQVFYDAGEYLEVVPYANISVIDSRRGTYTDRDGFFSIVLKKGQTLEFSAIGFEPAYYTLPDTLSDNRYTIIQLLREDTVLLPETVVYPWPRKDFFKVEFLAMNVDKKLEDLAEANLAEERMRNLRENLPADGAESAEYYLRQQTREYIYAGQVKPQNIFNPVAWAQFIKAWRDGAFKRKKE